MFINPRDGLMDGHNRHIIVHVWPINIKLRSLIFPRIVMWLLKPSLNIFLSVTSDLHRVTQNVYHICTVVLCFRSSRNSGQPQPSTSATQLERAESYGNDSTQAISVQDAINKFEHTTSSHLKGSTLISVLSLFPSSALTVFLVFTKLEKDL